MTSSFRHLPFWVGLPLAVLFAAEAAAECGASGFSTPVAAGFEAAPYADVTDPLRLSFDADGNLFAGRDAQGSGGSGADPVKIHRIAPGGAPVVEFGQAAVPDPDTVVVDRDGAWSGVPGTVLVGGTVSAEGSIVAILPDERLVTLFDRNLVFRNPNDMQFDREGRLLFTDLNSGFASTPPPPPQVLVSSAGEFPAQIVTHPTDPAFLAFDPDNNIYMSTPEGLIRVFDRDGVSITDDFAGDLGANTRIRFGPGGAWGDDLIAIDASTGELLEIDSAGSASVIGTGFVGFAGMTFGPDGSLYLSRFQEDCVWRVAPTGTPPPGATGQPIAGKELLLKWRAGKRKKSGIKLMAKDANVSFTGVVGSDEDPVRTGATLRVVSTEGDGFDTTYVLPRESWRYLKKKGVKKGLKFKGDGKPFTNVLVKSGKIKLVGKGKKLKHSLGADPDPVDVVLRLGSRKYCMRFGGKTRFKPEKSFLARKAPADSACPLP